jgi:beta-lactamase regulating signal transducer with metallopeptidase domain
MIGNPMFTHILTFNGWVERWTHAMGAVLWQSTLLIAIAAVVAWCLRRSSPSVRYWLWQIVAVKLLLMPFWTSYIPMPSWAGPAAPLVVLQQAEAPRDQPDKPAPVSQAAESSVADVVAHTPPAWKALAAVTWQAWLLPIWCAVVFWQLLRLLIQRTRLARLLKRGVPAAGELAELVAESAKELGFRRVPVAVAVADDCPLFVCGLWRPRIVLPDRLVAALGPAERRQVVLHELAHVKRRDLFWGWPVEIARIVYFFHPLVYWVAHQLRLERELACDQLAMVHSGHPPADYAQTLVRVVSHGSAPAVAQAAAIAAGVTGGVGQRPVDSPSPGHRPGERRPQR